MLIVRPLASTSESATEHTCGDDVGDRKDTSARTQAEQAASGDSIQHLTSSNGHSQKGPVWCPTESTGLCKARKVQGRTNATPGKTRRKKPAKKLRETSERPERTRKMPHKAPRQVASTCDLHNNAQSTGLPHWEQRPTAQC